MPAVSYAEENREFSSKTLRFNFDTSEEAKKWSFRALDFKDWLEAVSRPEWIELHKSDSDEFFFAVYRSGNHLIFCENDRRDVYSGASTSIRAVDDKVAYGVWEKPSMWTTLKWDVDYPSGRSGGQFTFTTYKIMEGYKGDIVVNYKVKNDDTKYRQVFRESVSWK